MPHLLIDWRCIIMSAYCRVQDIWAAKIICLWQWTVVSEYRLDSLPFSNRVLSQSCKYPVPSVRKPPTGSTGPIHRRYDAQVFRICFNCLEPV